MASAATVTRKTVTVLFCDLTESTRLGEQLDPESLRALMTRWHAAMRTAIERHEGTVEKFIGDAVMAVFGLPHVHEDDALRAVRAAVDMRDAVTSLGLRIRIGVNTGEVVAGGGETLVTGDAVNTAKRLEEAAAAGEILIGAATRQLVENAVELEPVGLVVARGKRDPVEAWRVRGTIPGAAPYSRRLDAPLVGRRDELAALRDELAAAERERRCRLVTVFGAAGVGKTRLASELLGDVRDGTRVLTARCLPYGDGITFLPLTELVESAGGDEAVAAAVASEPDAELVVDRLRAGGPSAETFWATRRLLETLARERPLVVCVEDVHWAEPTFLDLLEYVSAWSEDAPILLLCAARPELLDVRPRWGGTSLTLEPLTEEESEMLLDELAAEWPLSADARARIAGAAEGNPLFLEQMVAMLAEGDGTNEVPPSIQALLATRLDRLEPVERSVLECAAVVGKEFWRDAVVELSPEDRGAVAASLLSLARKELVRPAASAFLGDDGFAFRHVLIRDAAYAEIPKRTRAGLHESFAAWLEGRDAEPELVGYHLEQATLYLAELGTPDDALADRAAALLAAAGRTASARDDMHAARNLFERALALAELGDDRPVALRGLAGARWATGDLDGAADAIDHAIAAASDAGDVRQEWYARLERAARMHQLHAAEDELGAVATEAVRVFGSLGDDAGLCRAWRRLALLSYSNGRGADATEQAERALEHARRAGDAAEVARMADLYCSALVYGPEPAASATARCRELLAKEAPSRLFHAAVSSALAYLAAMQTSFDEAREEASRAAATYEELGLPLVRAGLAQFIGAIEMLAGDLDAAEQEFRLGRRLFAEAGATPLAGHLAALVARAILDSGRLDEAAELVDDAQSTVDDRDLLGVVNTRLAAARLAELRGRPEEAARLADEALERLVGTDMIFRADALAARGDLAAAIDLYERKGNVAAVALVTARAAR